MNVEDVTPGPHSVEFYYNLKTGQVEEGQQSKATDLWGPFPTREEAEHAMEKAHQRNEDWDHDNWHKD